jgi:exonuclease VII small subunit
MEIPQKTVLVYEADWKILTRIKSAAHDLDKCLSEFDDDIKLCSECFQRLHNALHESLRNEISIVKYVNE